MVTATAVGIVCSAAAVSSIVLLLIIVVHIARGRESL